jgi:hypothetical protein
VKERKRRIQLGWLNFDKKENRYIHVRTTSWGGTRNMHFPAAYTKEKVRQAAIDVFFLKMDSSRSLALRLTWSLTLQTLKWRK